MEIKNTFIIFIAISTFILLVILDFFNILQYIDYTQTINNTISNAITFISILIGFISTIYVMIQQNQESYVFKLLEKNNLIYTFNKSFKSFVYWGFIDVIILIILNFFANTFIIFKYLFCIAVPITVYFMLISNNLVTTICKMIVAENKLKSNDKQLTEKDLKGL